MPLPYRKFLFLIIGMFLLNGVLYAQAEKTKSPVTDQLNRIEGRLTAMEKGQAEIKAKQEEILKSLAFLRIRINRT